MGCWKILRSWRYIRSRQGHRATLAAAKEATAVAAAEKAATREAATGKATMAGAEWAATMHHDGSKEDIRGGWGSKQGSNKGGRWRMAEADDRCRNLGLVCGEA